MIEGLKENGVSVQAINVMPSGSFPMRDKRLFIQNKRWGENNRRIGYLNLPKVKWWGQQRKVYRYLCEALASDNPPEAIVCYYTHPPFLRALARVKKKFPSVKTLLIMTEAIPGRGDIVDTPRRKKLGDQMVNGSKLFDGFCLLTKYLNEPLEVGERPYVVLDGIADEKTPATNTERQEEKIFFPHQYPHRQLTLKKENNS